MAHVECATSEPGATAMSPAATLSLMVNAHLHTIGPRRFAGISGDAADGLCKDEEECDRRRPRLVQRLWVSWLCHPIPCYADSWACDQAGAEGSAVGLSTGR